MKAKILISYHDEHKLIKSDILQPIQTGCMTAKKRFKGMLQDDEGENISDKNNRYCELSAQYWAWKNQDKLGNPDYIGFMHYRRHFMFDDWSGNPDWCWLPKGSVYFVPNITPQYLTHISDENIQKCLEDCDCIVLKPYDVRFLESKNIRHQYSRLPEQDSKIFDEFIKITKKIYPDYISEIEMIEHGSIQYLCNMFIMPKDLFFEYNKFCFSILEELDKRVDSSNMSEVASRFLGYIGEFCLSIFIFHLKGNSKIRIKELNGAFILSDEVIENPKRKYWYYWFMSKITFGKKKKKYKQKRRQMKKYIKQLKVHAWKNLFSPCL